MSKKCTILLSSTSTHTRTTYPKATIKNLSLICHLASMPCSQSYLPCSHYTPNSWHHLFPLDVFRCSLRACHFAHAANTKGYVLHADSPSITVCQDYTAWMSHKAILKNIHDSLFTNGLFGDHRQPWSWGRQKFLSSSMGWSWEIYYMLGDLGEKLFPYFQYKISVGILSPNYDVQDSFGILSNIIFLFFSDPWAQS